MKEQGLRPASYARSPDRRRGGGGGGGGCCIVMESNCRRKDSQTPKTAYLKSERVMI